MHRLSVLLVAVLLAVAGCSPGPQAVQPPPKPAEPVSGMDAEELTARGQAITSQAFGLLSSNLLTAIQQSGVSNALPFCSALAMPLTSLVANTNDVTLRRVSHRPRNPVNRASAWERELIERYRSTLAAGEKPSPVLITNDTVTFYAPIVITNQLCLQCHGKPGEELALENLEVIRRLYPADEATGFGLGEIRGLWRIDFRGSATRTNQPAAGRAGVSAPARPAVASNARHFRVKINVGSIG
jgi:hypothetical protein